MSHSIRLMIRLQIRKFIVDRLESPLTWSTFDEKRAVSRYWIAWNLTNQSMLGESCNGWSRLEMPSHIMWSKCSSGNEFYVECSVETLDSLGPYYIYSTITPSFVSVQDRSLVNALGKNIRMVKAYLLYGRSWSMKKKVERSAYLKLRQDRVMEWWTNEYWVWKKSRNSF